MNLIFKDPW